MATYLFFYVAVPLCVVIYELERMRDEARKQLRELEKLRWAAYHTANVVDTVRRTCNEG